MKTVSILIIDDVDEMREMLGVLLSQEQGIKVSGLAANGWEARQQVERRRPDLILLDEVLPGESSRDLLEEWAADGLKVCLMTGIENATHELPARALGRIAKPDLESSRGDQQRWVQAVLRVAKGAT